MNEDNITYLDCKWYMGDGQCKMPSINGGFSACISLNKLDPFCAWLIPFLNTESNNNNDDVELPTSFKLDNGAY